MKQKITDVSEQENEWIAQQLRGATKFVSIYCPEQANRPLSLGALDRAYDLWLSSNETNADIINAVINRVGVTFGQFLVDAGEFKWVIACDELGTDLAIYALPGSADVLVYPANFCSQALGAARNEFLRNVLSENRGRR